MQCHSDDNQNLYLKRSTIFKYLRNGGAMKKYYVYMMTNHSKTLYTGVTNDLKRRVYEHKNKLVEGFTKRYNITKLVYYEETNSIHSALQREKQLKNWRRQWKIDLIESVNRDWDDLSDGWYE